ncbi:MAG: LPP20 family lipoprotein [Hahellaceae bacterium]|nr:LPP20 family lipoprotein [Hahellaceae bacterium]MCP5169679.1 LPP20 family lipoprotein [Hahellaceae bacterium]
MNLKKFATVAITSALMTACAGNQPQQAAPAPVAQPSPMSNLPSWVTLPIVENGFADTQCVQTVADMNILKNKAVALARAEIAKQINIQVKAMDKTYQSLTETANGAAVGSTFESVSKQVTSQKLSGSRPVKMDYINFPDGTQKLCVMVALDPSLTKSLYEELVAQSGRNLSPQSNEVLYQEFKAYKAQQEMDAEIEKAQ